MAIAWSETVVSMEALSLSPPMSPPVRQPNTPWIESGSCSGKALFATITRLSQKQPFADLADPTNRIHPFLRNRTKIQAREYVRLPNVVRKVREYEISPALFSSFSSSFSSSTASFGKMGFVGWYLGIVKSWPVLTKS
ncbi:hypothetical protein Gorai_023226, partial [Gossypium raimondii]|nr:hypothetical protein [Gossypium raimondii]